MTSTTWWQWWKSFFAQKNQKLFFFFFVFSFSFLDERHFDKKQNDRSPTNKQHRKSQCKQKKKLFFLFFLFLFEAFFFSLFFKTEFCFLMNFFLCVTENRENFFSLCFLLCFFFCFFFVCVFVYLGQNFDSVVRWRIEAERRIQSRGAPPSRRGPDTERPQSERRSLCTLRQRLSLTPSHTPTTTKTDPSLKYKNQKNKNIDK